MKASSQGIPQKERLQIMIFELEKITQLSSDDMFPQYIKKKNKNKQAKQKNCCSLSQLKKNKKTRSSTIRCVV